MDNLNQIADIIENSTRLVTFKRSSSHIFELSNYFGMSCPDLVKTIAYHGFRLYFKYLNKWLVIPNQSIKELKELEEYEVVFQIKLPEEMSDIKRETVLISDNIYITSFAQLYLSKIAENTLYRLMASTRTLELSRGSGENFNLGKKKNG